MTDISVRPIGVLVIDASHFGRACITAVLEAQAGFAISASANVDGFDGNMIPDVLLFQTAEASLAASPIAGELNRAMRRWPDTPALVIADCPDAQEMMIAVDAGAHGLLPASASVACIQGAITLLVSGMGVYPPALFARRSFDQLGYVPTSAIQGSGSSALGELKPLTQRQQDVLHLLALGSSNRGIAERLKISESTVKVHLRAIMTQNGATNRTQIVAQYLKRNGSRDN